jgi:hypothetical protein
MWGRVFRGSTACTGAPTSEQVIGGSEFVVEDSDPTGARSDACTVGR